jgi:hypothetical protein
VKYIAVVLVLGLYDGHNRIELRWTDQSWYSTRSECMKRAVEIAKDIENRIWYWRGLKLDRKPRPSCEEK